MQGLNVNEKEEGSCILYLPPNINISDGVNYQNVDLNVAGTALQQSLRQGGTIGRGLYEAFLTGTKAIRNSIYDAFTQNATELGSSASKIAVANIIRYLPDKVNWASGSLSSVAQVTHNPNTQVFFESVNVRTFSFSFKMQPSSQLEAEEIRKIIKFFRRELYPENIGFEESVGFAYKYPNKFRIKMYYGDPNQGGIKQVATKLTDCYLTSFETTYNPNTAVFYKDGNPQEVEISLSLTEQRTLNKSDIDRGY